MSNPGITQSVPRFELRVILWIAFATLCLTPVISGSVALLLGSALGLTLGNPFPAMSKRLSKGLLQASVIGLGAGTNLAIVAQVGLRGLSYTIVGITGTLALGYLLGRLFRVGSQISLLLSVGTAICGGSAIAAVAPVTHAKHHDITVSMAVIFLLNGVGLLLFPWIGHHFQLSQSEFGLWSALAIHDTSSVVGASLAYGKEALAIGTTVKLARSLWIAPVAVIFSMVHAGKNRTPGTSAKIPVPWFIAGFIGLAFIFTAVPQIKSFGAGIATVARQFLVLTLFVIGSQISRESIKEVGINPLLQGVVLWLIVASSTLIAIETHWISL